MKPTSETTVKETMNEMTGKKPPFISRKDHTKNSTQLELGYTITPDGQERIKEFKQDIELYEKQNAPKPVEAEVKNKNWLSDFTNFNIGSWVVGLIVFLGGGGWVVGYAWSQIQIDREKFTIEQEIVEVKEQRDSILKALAILKHTQDIPKGKKDSTDTKKNKP